jgi:2-polyprenylphenol 6-hydroxylase
MRPRDFDVLIVGGGMVGAALAALLRTEPRTRSLNVALVEPKPALMPLPREPLDVRVSALSRRSEQLLVETGAWPLITARTPCPYERMVVWDAASSPDAKDALVFDAAEAGERNLGHIVENRSVAAALIERAVALGVTLLRSPVTEFGATPDEARVVSGGRALTVALVVAADGADSPLRALAGIEGSPEAYPQTAIVAHLKPERPHTGTAYQRFLDGGPLALLPLADGCVSIVWSLPPTRADELMALDDAGFAQVVSDASDGVLGRLEVISPRVAHGLRHFNASTYAGVRLALVGDAAHSVHPLAGQGVNQGLLDVRALVRELALATSAGADVGDPAAIGRYARLRRTQNALVGQALDTIYRVYTSDQPLVRRARRFALEFANRMTPVKQALVSRALFGE